jgi:uncharacterized membrane protein YgcG
VHKAYSSTRAIAPTSNLPKFVNTMLRHGRGHPPLRYRGSHPWVGFDLVVLATADDHGGSRSGHGGSGSGSGRGGSDDSGHGSSRS